MSGRLSQVQIDTDGNGTPNETVTYKYDHSGSRVERIVGGQRTVYHVDPSNPTGYSQVLEEGVDADNDRELDGGVGGGEVAKAYTLGLRILTQALTTQVLHLLADDRGSTRAVLDIAQNPATAGAVLQRYAYSGYGLDLGLSGAGLTDVRYVGQLIDPTTGLSFNRARWYDREQGRFMQTDPWGGDGRNPLSLNKYLYGHGNPTNATDPSGRFSLLELLVTAVGGQSLEKLAGAARGVKVGIEATKMLVRLALVQMEILTRRLPPTEGKTHIFVTAYYLYSWYAFETAYKKKIAQAKLASKAHRLAKYVASLSGGAERLQEHGYDHHKGKRARFLPDDLKGLDEAIPSVFIPYTGARRNDYTLAYVAALAPEAFSLSKAVGELVYGTGDLSSIVREMGSLVDDVQIAGRTWHHSEILGIMESVDTSKHGSYRHAGGVSFWQILHNKTYG